MLIVSRGCDLVILHLNYIVHQDESSNDDRLSDFESVEASVDIDSVGAEDCQHAHVDEVGESQINGAVAQKVPHNLGKHDPGAAFVRDEDWDGGDRRHDKLVPPSEVDDIIDEAEQDDQANSKKRSKVLDLNLCQAQVDAPLFHLFDCVHTDDPLVNKDQDDGSEEEYDGGDDAEGLRTTNMQWLDTYDAQHLHFLFLLIFVVTQLVQVFTEETLLLQLALEFFDATVSEVERNDGKQSCSAETDLEATIGSDIL